MTDLKTILIDYREKFQDIADFASSADFGICFAGIFDRKITDVLTASMNSSIDLIDFILENEDTDLHELRKELQDTYDHISNAKSLCFDEKTKKDVLGRLGSKLRLMDYLIEVSECLEEVSECLEEPEESDCHQAYGADPDDLEEWSSMPGWGEPAWYALRFIDSLKNFVSGCQNVQRTERTQARLDFIETWRDATLERIKKWQALNKRLYRETIDD